MQPVSQAQVDAWYETIVEPLLRETTDWGLARDEPRTSKEIVGRHNYPNLRQMAGYYPWFAASVVTYDQAVEEALSTGGKITGSLSAATQRLRGALRDLIGFWGASRLLPASAGTMEREDRR